MMVAHKYKRTKNLPSNTSDLKYTTSAFRSLLNSLCTLLINTFILSIVKQRIYQGLHNP